ncbi:MAG: hypothetical protein M1827_007182 [Pycnora praestabilis]|nr:MAG: hypothetical protein M1827_007182 [Pycnora praestabilis]
MANKYDAPQGAPPQYPAQTYQQPQHLDAGPMYPPNPSPSPGPYYQSGPPGPYDGQRQGYGAPQQGYGPPQQGYYGGGPPQQQGMYYQQQPGQYGPPGAYGGGAGGRGAGVGEGLCAGLLGLTACCCCLDFCIF